MPEADGLQPAAVTVLDAVPETPAGPAPTQVPIGLGWSLAVLPEHLGARLRLTGAPGVTGLEIEIAVTPDGPVVRTRATALEVIATETVSVQCDRFTVDARTTVDIASGAELSLRAGTTARTSAQAVAVEATRGDVQLKSNDDVQLLGEQILLNCDREPAVPPWVPAVQAPPAQAVAVVPTVARKDTHGDTDLLAALEGSG